MRLAALSLLATFISCDTIVQPEQTVTLDPRTGAISTTGGTAPVAVAPFDAVDISLVDAGGCNAGAAVIHAGCVARFTATPKSRGVPVAAALHGPICLWFLDGQLVIGAASTAVVYVSATSNPFNLAAYGQAPGAITLEAEVMGVRSGARTFAVQP